MDQLDREGIVNPESRVRLATDGSTTLRGRPDVGRLGAGGGARLHPFPGQPDARAKWVAAKLEPLRGSLSGSR